MTKSYRRERSGRTAGVALPELRAELLAKDPLAFGRDRDGARAFHAADPALLETVRA